MGAEQSRPGVADLASKMRASPFAALAANLTSSRRAHCAEENKGGFGPLPDLPASSADDKIVSDLSQMPELDESAGEAVPDLIRQADEMAGETERISAPPQFDTLQQTPQRIVHLDAYEGARFEVTKPLSPLFAITHSFAMGGQQGGSYSFGANVAAGNALLISRMSQEGALDARYFHTLAPGLMSKVESHLEFPAEGQPENNSLRGVLEYTGDTCSGSLTSAIGSPLSLSYIQAITPRFLLGGQTTLPALGAPLQTNFIGRYAAPEWDGTGSVMQGPGGKILLAQFVRKVNSRLNLGTELVVDVAQRGTAVNVAGEFIFKNGRFCTSVDGNGVISSVMETKLGMQVTFALTSQVAHAANHYKFGYGMTIGS